MAEEAEDAGPSVDTGGLAADLAMEEARNDPGLRPHVAAFLHDQRRLIADQRHHLHLGVWEKRIGVALRLATLCVGLAFAASLAWMVWEARHSDGLKVEPFSVPPVMAERGLTGQVVAARVIDRLSELQSQTNTARPARSYSNSWGDKAIKLEIPETGVSLEEVDSWLRAKLGHETSLSGEVVRGETGVTLTARTPDGAVSVSGAEAEMDALTVRLAEAIYRLTQPYRYAIYLFRHENRPADAVPIFRQLALTGGAQERRWSYNMWANATQIATGDSELGLRMFLEAHNADPDANQPFPPLIGVTSGFGRWEEAVRFRKMQFKIPGGAAPISRASFDNLIGHYRDALPGDAARVRTGQPGIPQSILVLSLVSDQLGLHERTAARASLAEFRPDAQATALDAARLDLLIALDAADWRAALAHDGDMAAYLRERPRNRRYALVSYATPLAIAQAHLGDFAAAEKTIAPAPGDCLPCLIARARIAELQGQRARAEYWFTRATQAGPSLPFAFEAQGRALLDRGNPEQAIARFALANQKSPRFADALEGWGEALMARNQAHLALAKFAQAGKYAPNWGRLHLKWGEALAYAGKKDEAAAHFVRAAQLDLTPSEKRELAEAPHG